MGGDSPQQPATPAFQNSSVKFGDNTISSTAKDASGNVVTQYNMTPAQQQEYDYIQKQLPSTLQNVNVLSPDIQAGLQKQAQAQYDYGKGQYTDTYNQQMMANINDVARRFGGLNTSVLADTNYNNNKAYNTEMGNLSNQYTSNLQGLENNQLQQQYNYLNALNSSLSGLYGQGNNAMNYANTGSNMGNTFDTSLYGTQAGMYNAQTQADAITKAAQYQAVGNVATFAACI